MANVLTARWAAVLVVVLSAPIASIAIGQGASPPAAAPPAAAPAAPSGEPAARPASNMLAPYVRFDRLSGMTKGGVTSIAQDDTGYIWFGTEEGLSRYDGYEYKNYVPGKDLDNTLSNFTVNALAASKDSLWIGTVKGLNRLQFATNKFSVIKPDPQAGSIASEYIVALHLGKSGLLWIGTADAGVDSLNPQTGEIKHYRHNDNKPDSLSEDGITAVLETKDGLVWVAAGESGLNQLDPKTGKVTHFTHGDPTTTISNDQVTSLFEDAAGTLWVGTTNGLNRFDPATKTFKRFFDDADAPTWITTVIEGPDGGLWLGVKGVGVYRFDRTTGGIETYAHDGGDSTSIGHPWTSVAFADRGGVLWFGFHAGNVSKLYLLRRKFGFYRTSPGMSFLEDGDQVWLGTQGRGLRSLNLKTGSVKSYLDDELSATWTMKIVAGDKGSLWLATQDKGLLHYTPKTGELESYDSTSGLLASDAVFDIQKDADKLWIGMFGAGLSVLDTTKKTIETFTNEPKDPATLSSDAIVAFEQDRTNPDTLWIGTLDGLNAFDKKTSKVVRYMHDPAKPTSLSHQHVTDIHEDKAGRLWVATWGGGLNLLDRKTGNFTSFHTTQGLPSDVVLGILEDKTGVLWLTTIEGLARFNPADQKVITYRVGDGLQEDEFAQGGFYQGPSGRLYVGGPQGFNVFNPDDIKQDPYVPPVVLTKYESRGVPLPIPAAFSLGYRDQIALTFAGLAYASPQGNHYRYRLAGFEDWIETDRRFANYSGLPPGNYTFEVLASNAHGVWNDKPLRVPVHVTPPPWRTWWAYTGYGVALVLIGLLIWRRQRKQLDAMTQKHRLSELEKEMALTSAVQKGFFPTESSVRDGGLSLEGFYKSATQCSGDWWWWEARGDDYFILVGDVTGHGAGSAMVTAAVASCFRSLGSKVDDDLRLQEMNDEVLRVSQGQYHMTLTAVNVNIATGEFVIRSAGGVPVFALPPKGRTKVLMCPGMPLGSPHFEMGRLEGKLKPGERVLILTDGIPEVAMANTQLLGPRGVSNFYMQTRTSELKSALQQLISKVEGVQVGAQDDDWTAVLIQWGAADAVLDDTMTGGDTGTGLSVVQ